MTFAPKETTVAPTSMSQFAPPASGAPTIEPKLVICEEKSRWTLAPIGAAFSTIVAYVRSIWFRPA